MGTLVALPIKKKCLYCGKGFLTYDSDKVFCGTNCKFGRDYETQGKEKLKVKNNV
jgi:hypothetical protein